MDFLSHGKSWKIIFLKIGARYFRSHELVWIIRMISSNILLSCRAYKLCEHPLCGTVKWAKAFCSTTKKPLHQIQPKFYEQKLNDSSKFFRSAQWLRKCCVSNDFGITPWDCIFPYIIFGFKKFYLRLIYTYGDIIQYIKANYDTSESIWTHQLRFHKTGRCFHATFSEEI